MKDIYRDWIFMPPSEAIVPTAGWLCKLSLRFRETSGSRTLLTFTVMRERAIDQFLKGRRVERAMTGLDRLSYRERLEMIAERRLSWQPKDDYTLAHTIHLRSPCRSPLRKNILQLLSHYIGYLPL
jgi:hypothetical protein